MSYLEEQIERAELAQAEIARLDALRAQAATLEGLRAEVVRQARMGKIVAEMQALDPTLQAEAQALRAEAQSIRDDLAALDKQAQALAARLKPFRDRARVLEHKLAHDIVMGMADRYPREELAPVERHLAQIWRDTIADHALNTIRVQNVSARSLDVGMVALQLAGITSMPLYR
jgi:hypothetical protein